ncbi:MAG: cytochrome c5 family protein [Gammaproteobacteria bacterium]|nr:cytochrome c5 family protein [Gammaproteobacteria bacterium]
MTNWLFLNMRKWRSGIGVIIFWGCTSLFADHTSEHSIAQRIKPAEGVKSLKSDVKVASEKNLKPSETNIGQTRYQTLCISCHGMGVSGAPRLVAADWKERRKKGIEALLSNATQGIKAMPPKGTCMQCTQAELKATIAYMLKEADKH